MRGEDWVGGAGWLFFRKDAKERQRPQRKDQASKGTSAKRTQVASFNSKTGVCNGMAIGMAIRKITVTSVVAGHIRLD
jgi:hypothetical protein